MGGFASHEMGTCRMGADPGTSVLTPFCQAHDVPNLFVVDGSPFVTFPEKNPTLTIMALAVRAAGTSWSAVAPASCSGPLGLPLHADAASQTADSVVSA